MGLFDPVAIGRLELPNRIVMAPMTRNRAGAGNVPTELNALYYRQRANHGNRARGPPRQPGSTHITPRTRSPSTAGW